MCKPQKKKVAAAGKTISTKRMKKQAFYILLFCFMSISCSERRYIETNSYVYHSAEQHWGRGYFKLEVHYRYNYNGEVYSGWFLHDLGKIYSKKAFEEGDSILIKFREDKPGKSEFIRMSYDKDFMEGLKKVN